MKFKTLTEGILNSLNEDKNEKSAPYTVNAEFIKEGKNWKNTKDTEPLKKGESYKVSDKVVHTDDFQFRVEWEILRESTKSKDFMADKHSMYTAMIAERYWLQKYSAILKFDSKEEAQKEGWEV